jgi:hypothetical protein
VPRRTTELAVGCGLQAEILLQGDDIADSGVFNRVKAVRVEASLGKVGSRSEQVRWSKETADVISAKWW